MSAPDTWNSYALVSFEVGSGAEIQYAARMEDVNITVGDRDMDAVPGLDGSYLAIDRSAVAGQITFKLRPISIDSASAAGGLAQAYRGGAYDTSDPLACPTGAAASATLLATFLRGLFRIAILCTNDTSAVAAAGAVTAGKDGWRFWCQYARITSRGLSYSGQELVEDVTVKFPPRSATGVWNYDEESCTTAAMVALDTTLGAWTASLD